MGEFSVNFYLTKITKPDHKTYNFILVSVSWNKLRVRTTLNIKIDEKLWDKGKQRAKASSKNPRKVNDILDKIKLQLQNLYDNIYLEHKRVPSQAEVKTILNSLIKNKGAEPATKNKASHSKPFLKYFDEFIKDSLNGTRLSNEGSKIQESTVISYKTTRNHLAKLIKQKNWTNLTFDDINSSFFSALVNYLSSEKITNNSQGRLIKVIKSFMRYYLEQGLHKNTSFIKDLKVLKEETEQIALNSEELARIENLVSINDKMQRTKDVFLFQTYSGLRYSDLKNLKPENINYTGNFITLYTIKTKDSITLALTKKMLEILNKYNGKLPIISSQKYNEAIKELGKLAEINEAIQITKYIGNKRIEERKLKYELMSSHTARRSFITISLVKNVIPEYIMKQTGHTSRKTFDKYIRITEKEAQNAIINAWE